VVATVEPEPSAVTVRLKERLAEPPSRRPPVVTATAPVPRWPTEEIASVPAVTVVPPV
jgi:hypothetical protein